MGKIKTLAGWTGTFSSYFTKGDEIDEATYDHFLNILPPLSLKGGQGYYAGFQVSEPICDGIDDNDRMRALYNTFGEKDGRHFYLGLNFKGEVNSCYKPCIYTG